jgi:hypothetical protein
MDQLPPQAIQLPGETPKVTYQEKIILRSFDKHCKTMTCEASALAIINPQRYGEMKRYLDLLYKDIHAFYEAFETVEPEQVAEEAIQ